MKFLFLLLLILAVAYYVISNERATELNSCYVQPELLNDVASTTSTLNPNLLTKPWSANWICCPQGPLRDYGVTYFRKALHLQEKPDSYVIHVTADNRYKLYVNGTKVCAGPAKSSFENWDFDSIDIAPFLLAGDNTICAIVWNYGVHAPVWQLSHQIGFLVQGNSETEENINSNQSWKCYYSSAYEPITYQFGDFPGYYALGPGDRIDGNLIPWEWHTPSFDDQSWQSAKLIGNGNMPQLAFWNRTPWLLQKRSIPFIPEGPIVRHKEIVRQDNIKITPEFLNGTSPIKIDSKTKVSVLFDLNEITTAYPEIVLKGGMNAEIKVTYAECLWKVTEVQNEDDKQTTKIYEKGNRNDFKDKVILGNWDIFIADGGLRLFTPLYWRSWRFLQLDIQTDEDPLLLCDVRGRFSCYPYTQKAAFKSDQSVLQDIWNIGWRTTQLCANDLFLDCPYYEQLNYSADARIQALMAYTQTNDDRLAKRSIEAISHSIQANGMLQDRYPSKIPQYILSWSLDWIQLLYDFWLYRQDADFVAKQLPVARLILDWFARNVDSNTHLLKSFEADWNSPPERISMEYYLALESAAKMEESMFSSMMSKHYHEQAENLKEGLKVYIKNDTKQNMGPNLARIVNSLIVLCDLIPMEEQQLLMQQTLLYPYIGTHDDFFSNYYWLYYMHEAMRKCGLGELYLDVLNPWENMIAEGLTTWAESFPPTRSDCHAWSCSPNIHFLTLVCGIQPIKPGFREVRIAPHLGLLESVSAQMPHPMGSIEVELKRTPEGGLSGKIALPPSVKGEFVWSSSIIKLHSGMQEIHL